MRLLLIMLLWVGLAAGCANQPPPDVASDPGVDVDLPDADQAEEILEDEGDPADIVSGVGTITYVEIEGGFYGLVAEDGTKYNPLNLDEDFQEDGLRVRFRGQVRTDVMTTRMWGKNLEIEEMLRVTVDDN